MKHEHTFQFDKTTCKIMSTSSPALKQLTSCANHEDTPYRKRTLLTEAVHVSVSLNCCYKLQAIEPDELLAAMFRTEYTVCTHFLPWK